MEHQSIIDKLPSIGNPELAELLRLHHRTPEYREALVNEALARILIVMEPKQLDVGDLLK